MIISLFLDDKIVKYTLPTDIFGSYSFGIDDNDHMFNIEARDNKWVLYKTKESHILSGDIVIDSVEVKPNCFYFIRYKNKIYVLYVTSIELNSINTYSIKENTIINIGENSDIIYNCPLVKGQLFSLSFENNFIKITKQTTIPIYLNKMVLVPNESYINYGDVIELYGLKLIALKGKVLVSANPNVLVGSTNVMTKLSIPSTDKFSDAEITSVALYKKTDYFSKAARLYRTIEDKHIQLISAPKLSSDEDKVPALVTVGPMMTMAITSMISVATTINRILAGETTWKDSAAIVISSVLMAISSLVWPIITKVFNDKTTKKQETKILDKYSKYLNEKVEELQHEVVNEKDIIKENLVSVSECLDIINKRNVLFWSRRIDQKDFLEFRIGVGRQELKATLDYPTEGFSLDESELKKKVDDIAEKFKYIDDVPYSYNFAENRITAIMGKYKESLEFVKNILVQALTFYSHEDLKIVVFTNKEHSKEWEFAKYLLHSFDNLKKFRFFSTQAEEAKNVLDYLWKEINTRSDSSNNKPHYLVIIDDYSQIKRLISTKELMEKDGKYGISYIIIEDKLGNLPSKCTNFLNIDGENSALLKSSYANYIKFKTEIVHNINMMNISKILSNVPIEFENNGIGESLPDSISFLEMEKVGKVEQLNILNRWKTNDCTRSLAAEVGMSETGEMMRLDLHEKKHGPHGLIAGMTGSGKSEFIVSYILSMAINYSPDDVSFIIIDYKGGGLAGVFQNKYGRLPHLAGTITNLDKAEINRALVSINSEIQRRQVIFNEAKEMLDGSTIDIYKYQKLYKEGKLDKPVPHLFIICDEFAELKTQQPDFMDNLITVARIGRSLGIHLILATQKPSGVVDGQIWSNTKFRVCFKVQDEADSREMLKRNEAASLKQTGRFYLQVGFDELFIVGQSAWSGAKYYPSDSLIKTVDKSINIIDNCGSTIKSGSESNELQVIAQGEQLTAILNSIIEAAKTSNKVARKLWLDNIPSTVLVEQLEKKYKFQPNIENIEAIIGEFDNPEMQQQGLVKFNYLQNGNTAFYASNGMESEFALNTLIFSSSRCFKSDLINFYIIDYGSESLKKYTDLPHVGGIVFNGDDEKFDNLLKMIKKESNNRRKILSNYDGGIIQYNKKNDKKMPLLVVIMNNYSTIYEEHKTLYDTLPDLIRDSERNGIIFILTAKTSSDIHNRISQNLKSSFTFQQKDPSEYMSIFNSRVKVFPSDLFGRGLANIKGIHEFQTASILEDDEKVSDYLIGYNEFMKKHNSTVAKRIPILPDNISFDIVSNFISNPYNIPVGMSKDKLEVVCYDFFEDNVNVITSNKIDNILNFSKSLITVFNKLSNVETYIIDVTNSLGLDNLSNSINSSELCTNFLNYLIQSTNETSNKEKMIIIYNFSKFMSKVDPTLFASLIKNIKANENYAIILIDTASKIKPFQGESWYFETVQNNDGIWIGNGVLDQSIIRLSLYNSSNSKEISNNMGYVILDGVEDECKFIDFYKE